MEVVAAIEALTEAAKVAKAIWDDYQAGKVVLSDTDATAVHAALLQAQAVTADIRPQVDSALDAASKK